MTHLFAAEMLKLRTVRATWGFVIVAVIFAGLFTAGNIGGARAADRLEPDFQFRMVLDAAFPAAILSLLLGMILVTNEFRHGTIARTLLATPKRGHMLATKLLAGGASGLGLFLTTFLVTAVTAVVWLGILDIPLELGDVGDGAWRALVCAVVAGVLGAAIGGAVHSQVGALVGALVWLFVAEPLCWVLLGILDVGGVAEYLPAAALGGLIDSSAEGLSFAGSAAVSLAWVAVAAAAAFFRLRRRDIT